MTAEGMKPVYQSQDIRFEQDKCDLSYSKYNSLSRKSVFKS